VWFNSPQNALMAADLSLFVVGVFKPSNGVPHCFSGTLDICNRAGEGLEAV
jgi:hypothetical protein